MIKAIVKFWGDRRDEFGMPEPYNSYLIVSSPWHQGSGSIASVFPLSGQMLQQKHFLADRGNERDALNIAVVRLKSEPSNVGLEFDLHEE